MAICVDREKCIGCESCIAVCPVGALNMVDGKANIDQDTCIACGACIGECPVEAIEREEIVREVKNKEGKDLWVNVELEDGELFMNCLVSAPNWRLKQIRNAALF